jgi:hypothetical protein
MDRRVRFQLHRGLDPGRGGVDDRHAGEHVRLVDAIAKLRGCGGELDPRVHAFGVAGRGLVGRDARALLHEHPHGIGQVELALGVGGIEPLERRPEPLGLEDVDRGVELGDSLLVVREVSGLDDRLDRAVLAADDPAVASRVLAGEGEHGGGGTRAAVRGEQASERFRANQRGVAREHEHVSPVTVQRGA